MSGAGSRGIAESLARSRLHHQLKAHMSELGYSSDRQKQGVVPAPEIARINPVRGTIAYGETVLRGDLRRRRCHERLLFFSQRRTRRRSSILFFIGIHEADQQELESLLGRLGIRSGTRGGHVHVVPIPPSAPAANSGRRCSALPLNS